MDNIQMHKVYGDRFTAEELNLIVNVINLLINGEDDYNRNFTTEEKTKLANLDLVIDSINELKEDKSSKQIISDVEYDALVASGEVLPGVLYYTYET